MSKRLLLFAVSGLLALAGVLGAVPGSSAASPPAWGNAADVPGLTALNGGGYAVINSVSCSGADDCAAGGTYAPSAGKYQAFVVDETNTTWGTAIKVPGSGTLNAGNDAVVYAISCSTPGNCAAAGSYTDASHNTQAFVATETSGTWGNAIEVPGTAALNSGGYAEVNSVSCPTDGNCAAGGTYSDGNLAGQAFVVDETNGTWGNAVEVPGTGGLNAGGNATVNSVSCASAGNCTAGGDYVDGTGSSQMFVVDETSGTWGNAVEVPGTDSLNVGGSSNLTSVSCGAAGDCTAGGYYRDGSAHDQAFVANETNGAWGNAVQVPGTNSLNTAGAADLVSVSCTAVGTCTAGGYYRDTTGYQAFAVDETNGSWSNAFEVPGTAALNVGGSATIQSLSCASAGNCAADGTYHDGAHQLQAFVVAETNGTWGAAIEVPGTDALYAGGSADVSSISCGTPGDCSAGGSYSGGSGSQAFVVSSVPSTKSDQTIQVTTPAPASAAYGTEFTVAATGGGSGNPVIFGSSGGCTNSGADFTMTSGTTNCTVTFDQAGNSKYNPAPEVTEIVTTQKADQTINVTTHAPATAAYGASFSVTATAPGGLVSYSSSGSCSNAGATFTMTSSTGTCTVHYNIAGNANYNAAPEVTESVTAQKASQSISFSPLAAHTYGDADFAPGATATSGLTVSYGASGNCSIVAGKVHIMGAGSCTVTASQSGNANYNAATPVQQGFSIGQASLTITATDQQKAYGQTLDLGTSAFTPSGLVGSDSITAVTLTSAGAASGADVGNYPIVPSAAVAGNGTDLGNYTVSYANGTLQVKQLGQTIDFSKPSDRTWGDADFDPGATATSGLAVSYGAQGNCSIVGGLVHLTGAGSCTVTASQAGNTDYAAATPVQQTFSIAKFAVTVTATDQQKLRNETLTLGTTGFTTSALVGSDSISAVTLTSPGAVATAAAGNYSIVPSAAVAGNGTNLNNYAITYDNGTLTVLTAGLVGLNGVSVSTKGGTIDSFDSSHGAYRGSNHSAAALVLSNGAISLAGVALSGDAMSTEGAVSLGTDATVSGTVSSTPSPAVSWPPVARCTQLTAKLSLKGKGAKFTYSAKTGNLKLVKGTAKLANGTYCFNNVTLSPKTTLVVGGPVTIHLRGKLTGAGQLVNKTSKPANLHIDTSYTGANGIAIVGNNHAYMSVVAPGTTVTVANGSYFGTLLAGTVKLTGKTAFHEDLH